MGASSSARYSSGFARPGSFVCNVDGCNGIEQLRVRLRDFYRPLGGDEAFGSPPQRHEDLRALELQCRVLAVARERRRDDVERLGEVLTRLLDFACEQGGDAGSPDSLRRQPSPPDRPLEQLARGPNVLIGSRVHGALYLRAIA